MRRIEYVILLAGLLISTSTLTGQINKMGDMMIGGKEDGALLVKEYITPFANSLGANLSGGWYNTAQPHKLGGFDLTFTMNTAFIPEPDKSFDIGALGLQSTSGEGKAPTAAGKKEPGPELTTGEGITYYSPPGSGAGFIPSPLIKIGVGFIKETELNGRFMPNMKLGKFGEMGLWGFGIKHSLKQYIPAIKKAPVFNLSLMAGYSKLSSSFNLDLQPEDYNAEEIDLEPGTSFDEQTMEVDVKNFTSNLLVSFDLPVVCFYGGAGLSYAKSNLKFIGFYPMIEMDNNNNPVVEKAMEDPLDIEIENKDGSTTKPRLNAGVRFKMGVITLHFDYTKAYYSIATAGLGISFR